MGGRGIVSTAKEWARFDTALLSGKVLAPGQLKETLTTVAEEPGNPNRYGLGLEQVTTPCGPGPGPGRGQLPDRHQARPAAPPAANLDSIDALRAWCDKAADRQDAMGCVGGCEIGSLASELAETDPSARTDLSASFDRWELPIRSGLVRMQTRGELSERADVAALATALLAAIQGGMLLSQVRWSSTAYRHAVSVVIDHIESYVVP